MSKAKLAIISAALAACLCAALYARYPLKYAGAITRYAREYGLPPALVCAVINAESRFRPNVRSKPGAAGLMQLMPQTAAWGAEELNITNPDIFDPETNIAIGCWYLSRLQTQYGSRLTALAAYNAGSGNVTGWINEYGPLADIEDIRYPETRRYAARVLEDEQAYAVILKLAGY